MEPTPISEPCSGFWGTCLKHDTDIAYCNKRRAEAGLGPIEPQEMACRNETVDSLDRCYKALNKLEVVLSRMVVLMEGKGQ